MTVEVPVIAPGRSCFLRWGLCFVLTGFVKALICSISETPKNRDFHQWHSQNPIQLSKALPSVNLMPDFFTSKPELDFEMNTAGSPHTDPMLPLAFSGSCYPCTALLLSRSSWCGNINVPSAGSFLSSGFVLNVTLALARTQEGHMWRDLWRRVYLAITPSLDLRASEMLWLGRRAAFLSDPLTIHDLTEAESREGRTLQTTGTLNDPH